MDDNGGGKATITDVWHKLGKIEGDIEHVIKRIEPVETFAKGYAADRNRLLGAVAAVAAFATFLVTGVKQWIMGIVGPA